MPFLCSGPVFFMDLASGTEGSSKGKGRDFFGCNDLFRGPCGELCKSVAGGVFVEGCRRKMWQKNAAEGCCGRVLQEDAAEEFCGRISREKTGIPISCWQTVTLGQDIVALCKSVENNRKVGKNRLIFA